MSVVTRFAPSPTGFLHIGGARTALFNWLYARRHGGRFLLRIEDTDRARSTQAAVDAIVNGLQWLGLVWDGEAVSQAARQARHAEIAYALLEKGAAYRCYASPEELTAMREAQRAAGQTIRYDGRWRDSDPAEAPAGIPPVIRLRAPQTGETVIADRVQGEVRVRNDQLDDMVLLRADGTPTYMLAVVVDDRDMEITHVIRGDDHLTNAFRQTLIYQAMGWTPPSFAHIPLIHGPDGAKLSKRHGALGVEAYRDMGYLPEALRNYLLRLGWAHGDEEIIPTERAVAWFDLDGVGRSAARFDFAKLENLNGHYIRSAEDGYLCDMVVPRLEDSLGREFAEPERALLCRAMPELKSRAKTLVELAHSALFFYRKRPFPKTEKADKLLLQAGLPLLSEIKATLASLTDWQAANIEAALRELAETRDEKLGTLAQPLRAALTGSTVSPPIFLVAELLGRGETLARLQDSLDS